MNNTSSHPLKLLVFCFHVALEKSHLTPILAIFQNTWAVIPVSSLPSTFTGTQRKGTLNWVMSFTSAESSLQGESIWQVTVAVPQMNWKKMKNVPSHNLLLLKPRCCLNPKEFSSSHFVWFSLKINEYFTSNNQDSPKTDNNTVLPHEKNPYFLGSETGAKHFAPTPSLAPGSG